LKIELQHCKNLVNEKEKKIRNYKRTIYKKTQKEQKECGRKNQSARKEQ